jgi:hypothetical protein
MSASLRQTSDSWYFISEKAKKTRVGLCSNPGPLEVEMMGCRVADLVMVYCGSGKGKIEESIVEKNSGKEAEERTCGC